MSEKNELYNAITSSDFLKNGVLNSILWKTRPTADSPEHENRPVVHIGTAKNFQIRLVPNTAPDTWSMALYRLEDCRGEDFPDVISYKPVLSDVFLPAGLDLEQAKCACVAAILDWAQDKYEAEYKEYETVMNDFGDLDAVMSEKSAAALGDKSLTVIGIPSRVVTVLFNAGVCTATDLAALRLEQLKNLDGMGRKTLDEIQEAMRANHMRFIDDAVEIQTVSQDGVCLGMDWQNFPMNSNDGSGTGLHIGRLKDYALAVSDCDGNGEYAVRLMRVGLSKSYRGDGNKAPTLWPTFSDIMPVASVSASTLEEAKRLSVLAVLDYYNRFHAAAVSFCNEIYDVFGNLDRVRSDRALDEVRNESVASMEIPNATAQALIANGIETTGSLMAMKSTEIGKLKGIGPKAVEAIKTAASNMALRFSDESAQRIVPNIHKV